MSGYMRLCRDVYIYIGALYISQVLHFQGSAKRMRNNREAARSNEGLMLKPWALVWARNPGIPTSEFLNP